MNTYSHAYRLMFICLVWILRWTAAAGNVSLNGMILPAALYFWQIPHFMALAYLCRNDYAAGGYEIFFSRFKYSSMIYQASHFIIKQYPKLFQHQLSGCLQFWLVYCVLYLKTVHGKNYLSKLYCKLEAYYDMNCGVTLNKVCC